MDDLDDLEVSLFQETGILGRWIFGSYENGMTMQPAKNAEASDFTKLKLQRGVCFDLSLLQNHGSN